MPSTDTKPELTAKASMAQPVSRPAVYANGLKNRPIPLLHLCAYVASYRVNFTFTFTHPTFRNKQVFPRSMIVTIAAIVN
jgi:hypothetical protein